MIEKIKIIFSIIKNKLNNPRSRSNLIRLQQKKLKKSLIRTTKNISYYSSYQNKQFSEFPIINKKKYLEQFSDFNCLGLDANQASSLAAAEEQFNTTEVSLMKTKLKIPLSYNFGLSTGTSGQRGVFITDKKERRDWVVQIVGRCLPLPVFKKIKVALFLRANNQLYKEANTSGKLSLKFFDLNKGIDKLSQELEIYKPDVLLAPPYILSSLAKSPTKEINPIKVFSIADIKDLFEHKMISSYFNCPLGEIYQATEGFLGVSCKYGTLHLNEDLLLFEKIYLNEEKTKFVPVITDFHRRSQAIVRFKLSDVLKIDLNPCVCGSPLQTIASVESRLDEIFFIKSIQGQLKPIFRDLIIETITEGSDPGFNFELKQLSPSNFTLNVEKQGSMDWARKAEARFKFLLNSLNIVDYNFTISNNLEKKLFEKRRRVIRGFEPNLKELSGVWLEVFG